MFAAASSERSWGTAISNGDSRQGRPIQWNDPEPWPEAVNGAKLLDELKGKVSHYAVMPEGGAEAMTLWALYSWVFRAFATSPYLMVTAPEREAGKTRVTELLSWMARRAKPASDASAAAIIRGIESDGPTLIFDEAQHFLKRRPEDPMRGILLAGFTKRFATVERCEGDAHEVRAFVPAGAGIPTRRAHRRDSVRPARAKPPTPPAPNSRGTPTRQRTRTDCHPSDGGPNPLPPRPDFAAHLVTREV